MEKNIKDLIGNTPLIKLSKKINKYDNINVFVKLEYFNPSGSIKDRIVKYILDDAFENKKINTDTTILEASSGNTATALAMLCSYYGLKCIIVTNSKCSNEKVNTIKSFGASKVIIQECCPASSPEHYQNVALRLAKENPSYFLFNQYNNKLNSEAYYKTLGPEIFEQTNGKVDYLICASSTGGTISGTGRYLKENNKSIKVVLADPVSSILYDHVKKKRPSAEGKLSTVIEGIGKEAIPGVIDFNIIDDAIKVSDHDAIEMCHKLAKSEGIFAGGSGGANVWSALELAKNINSHTSAQKPVNIVTIIPDTGFKYTSKIYNPKWLDTIWDVKR